MLAVNVVVAGEVEYRTATEVVTLLNCEMNYQLITEKDYNNWYDFTCTDNVSTINTAGDYDSVVLINSVRFECSVIDFLYASQENFLLRMVCSTKQRINPQ